MEEYAANSHRSKEEPKGNISPEKKVGKVINGSARVKKKGEIQKFTDVFISEDISNVKSYIIMDVLIPAVKKAISDIVTNGVDMMLYGESGRTKRNNSATKVSYGKIYDRDADARRDYRGNVRGACDYDDILFTNRGDAETVLDAMNDIIGQYGVVSVLDLYDLADVSTNNHTCSKYGWKNIGGARAVRVRDGYVLKLPKAGPLD